MPQADSDCPSPVALSTDLSPQAHSVATPSSGSRTETVTLHRELRHIGQPQEDVLAGRQVAYACLEDVRPFLVEQVCAMTLLDRFVIRPECGLSFLHSATTSVPSMTASKPQTAAPSSRGKV